MPIQILPKDVASKIAAGEVVERPVSVIKELVENSIDAGATEIRINVTDAGRKKIEVIDNGGGIAVEEADKAIERYATSKISTAEDLNKIRTLGFRGEALASISAVSQFTLTSRVEGAAAGFNCLIEGGEIRKVNETGRQVGTTIIVENLFYNVPARLKFLKKDITERRLINQLVTRYALYYANIRFALTHDGKKIITTNGNGSRQEILSQLYDLETARKMLPVNYSDMYIKIEGFTSPHDLTRASRQEIYFFINGRLVNDASITSAITRGYYGLLMVGRYPISILFIEIPPEEVDVNVHPTKAEIRIKDPSQVFTAIQRTIKKTISAFAPFPAVSPSMWSAAHDGANHEIEQPPQLFSDGQTLADKGQSGIQNERPTHEGKIPLLRLIGQLGLTYIAAEGPDGLYLIDQHAAHERVLYEKLDINRSDMRSQLLLEPAVVTFPDTKMEKILDDLEMTKSIGFTVEEFGPQSFKILAVPQVLINHDPEEAFRSALEQDDEDESGIVETAEKNIVITRICKRLAIKAGQNMAVAEQEKLIRDLENCRNPRTCPHGRPTMIHFPVDVLDRRFGRKGSV